MSHGGFGGGGGGHGGGGGYGHEGMGHHDSGCFGHDHGHGGFGQHEGASLLGHGAVSVGHGGTMIGHILNALGLGGNVHHSVHQQAGNHPDQSPLWNQAMQAGKGRRGFLGRLDMRPFLIVTSIFLGCFLWLCVIRAVHNSRIASASSAHTATTAYQVPASYTTPGSYTASAGSYGGSAASYNPNAASYAQPQSYSASSGYGVNSYAQSQSSAASNYAAQYMNAATTAGARSAYGSASPYGYGTDYGSNLRRRSNPYLAQALPPPAAGTTAYSSPPRATYPMTSAYAGYGTGAAQAASAPVTLTAGAQTRYAPEANGHLRLMVSR